MTRKKKTIRELDLAEKRLLVRVDFNVPLSNDGNIGDDRRMRAAVPTIRHATKQGATVVLMTHLGRPGGKADENLSTSKVAGRLQQLLDDTRVESIPTIAGEKAREAVEALSRGGVLLLENLRFDAGEKSGDEAFAGRLRELGEIYINDAFATCHRKHASMFAVPKLFPRDCRAIGLLVEQELKALDELLDSTQTPMIAVLGGAKVADKIGAVEALLDHCEQVFVGGAMAFTFLQARGIGVGNSRVEEDKLELAGRLLQRAGERIVLPEDTIAAPDPGATEEARTVGQEIPEGWCGLDIGPRTIERWQKAIREAARVVWNGPVGKFEDEPFRQGTQAIAQALAESDATTVVGGGETGEAVEQMGLVDRMNHVSTGGGAFLEYLEKRSLPALSVIEKP